MNGITEFTRRNHADARRCPPTGARHQRIAPWPARRVLFAGTGVVFLVLWGSTGCERAPLTPNGVIGVFGGVGLGPGEFSYPRAITAEPTGSVYVVDKAGRVQRFAADGRFELDWRMPETERGKPVGLSFEFGDLLYVADTHYDRVMIFDRSGKPAGTFGSDGSSGIRLPTDVAVDAQGFIYVSEYHENDRITKWSADFQFVAAFGDEPIDGRHLSRPSGIDIDDEQTLWVADACNHRIVRFSLEGEVLMTFGTYGREVGQLRYPYDIDTSPEGTLLVCEYGGDRLQWFSRDGRSLRVWGRSGRAPGELSGPWGATYGPDGNVYVVDSLNSRVQIIRP